MFLLFLLHPHLQLAHAKKPHAIAFRSPGLYPEGMAWDPSAQHFVVGSLRSRSIHAVSDAGVVEDLIRDDSLPPNSTIGGVAVDSPRNRVLAVVHSIAPLPPFNALAAYDLRSPGRLFLSLLPPSPSGHDGANDVAVDFDGNAFVTNSFADLIWKVSPDGVASIFSRSPGLHLVPRRRESPHSYCGLNGIAYAGRGYLLWSSPTRGRCTRWTRRTARRGSCLLDRDLLLADDVAVRRDGVVLVVSMNRLWFLKSDDGWGQGVVYDEAELDVERFPTSVAVGAEERAYVLYGHVLEGLGRSAADAAAAAAGRREWFGIEEVRSEREHKDEKVWIYVVLGLGLAYFTFWRFQMKKLVTNMNKKTN
ncbi:hypothetical protein EUGRSUZ_L01715 [Eucalyptus grandis]|uniref:SMP-30/Gluconolactonase/LRE-like region domain-containing protein n=1 Tax=Eucalyptus grandis TaxID=71139 RepID=A0A058ZSF5_EUCGR|nr:hypothetical protein EUGRSUZ_L01715 [Eucalyptus grandis]